jgi:hypothetical protein
MTCKYRESNLKRTQDTNVTRTGREETRNKLNYILENLKSWNLRTKISSEGRIQDEIREIHATETF